MEIRVRERLIGALVLVAVVVLVVPAILKGRGPEPAEAPNAQTRRVEVPLGDTPGATDDPGLVPEPELPGTTPGASPAEPNPASAMPVAESPAPPVAQEAVPKKPAPSPAPVEKKTAPAPAPAPKPVAAPAPPTAKPDALPAAWAVQLGAYASREKADRFVADLRKRGFSAFVLEYRASGKVLYRVRVGPEQDRGRAEAIAARLAKEGYQPVVARHP